MHNFTKGNEQLFLNVAAGLVGSLFKRPKIFECAANCGNVRILKILDASGITKKLF